MPIKGLTDRPPRLPRIGKIHLGVKIKAKSGADYPKATDYFVFEPDHPQYAELVQAYGEKPNELRILLPIEDETKFAQQFYRLYSMTRGLVCKGDGESALRMVDKVTGAVANRNTKEVEMRQIPCQGRDCPEYGPRACGEVMNLQFLLPEVSGFGVWQIDTGSINSIINVNSALDLIRSVYGRISMVPLILALEPKEVVNPDDGKKKTVRVLNIRSQDKMIEAYRKAQLPAYQLIESMAETGEIEVGEAAELPPAGDEHPHGDLPVVSEVGPGTDTDAWPKDPKHAAEVAVGDIPEISRDDTLPIGQLGEKLRIKETGQVLYWHQHDAKSGNWRETPPEPVIVTDQPVKEEAQAKETEAKIEPNEGMSFNDLIAWVKAHKRTEGWLFKTFGFTVAQAKEKPYDCACEVKRMMNW